MKNSRVRIAILLVTLMMLLFTVAAHASTGKTPATPGEQPWMVALVDSQTANAHEGQFCGGSLIAPDWVLTASHCLEGIQDASEVDVVVGRHVLSSSDGERIQAAELFAHAGYPSYADGEDNDIGLIRLSRPATAGTPIKLINDNNEYVDDPGSLARVTGWGVLSEDDDNTPDVLHGVNVPVVTQAACATVYGEDLLDDTLCAGPENGGGDSCYGDSGGPLVSYENDGTPVQIGIVSWGEECGAAGQYGVYVRLTAYQDWLTGVMNGTVSTLDPADIGFDNDWHDEGDWEDGEGADDEWDDGEWIDDEDWSDDEFWGDDDWEFEDDWSDEFEDDEYYDDAYDDEFNWNDIEFWLLLLGF